MTFLSAVIVGLAEGAVLLLMSSGLWLTFGTMRILNMAHGGFFMLGGFLLYSFTTAGATSVGTFLLAIVAAAVAVAGVGLAVEAGVYRRIYKIDHLSSLLSTFAVLVIFEGAVNQIWGVNPLAALPPGYIINGVNILGVVVPRYCLLEVIAAAIVVGGLYLFLQRTRIGLEVRAVSLNRSMAGLMGVRINRVFAIAFAAGCFLAGLGGALIGSQISLTSSLGGDYVTEAFAVVLVGGIGSLRGIIVSSLLLGILDSIVAIYLPQYGGYTLYVGMIAVLLLRPQGLFGKEAVFQL